MSALTHEFLGKALEVWRLTVPDIVVDRIEMDCLSQERALLEGRIAVGLNADTDVSSGGGFRASAPVKGGCYTRLVQDSYTDFHLDIVPNGYDYRIAQM
jgi:hypothetical protein